MTRVFLPLLLLAVVGAAVWAVRSWWWRAVGAAEARTKAAHERLYLARESYDRELERTRQLMAERDVLLADIKRMLDRDAEDFPFLSKHLRQVAQDLVAEYDKEKGTS